MKVIVVLIGSWLLAMAISKGITGDWHIIQSGSIAMCAMLLFSAIAHFAFPKGMSSSIQTPDINPVDRVLYTDPASQYFCGYAPCRS